MAMDETKALAAVIPLKAGGRIAGIVPQTIEEVFRLATAVSKSGIAPRGMDKPEAITVAIMHGLEIGLPPMQAIQRIAVINGRPTVWGDAIPALLWARGFSMREWTDGEKDQLTAYCTVTRPTGEAITRAFSVADARKAGLWGKSGPWQQYPDRMLAMRARGFASRDGAPDVLGGLYTAEEIADAPAELKDITPRKSSAAAKRDGDMDTFNEIKGQINDASSVSALERLRELYADELAVMPFGWIKLLEDDFELKAASFVEAAE